MSFAFKRHNFGSIEESGLGRNANKGNDIIRRVTSNQIMGVQSRPKKRRWTIDSKDGMNIEIIIFGK